VVLARSIALIAIEFRVCKFFPFKIAKNIFKNSQPSSAKDGWNVHYAGDDHAWFIMAITILMLKVLVMVMVHMMFVMMISICFN
jgi:hypothetical protein